MKPLNVVEQNLVWVFFKVKKKYFLIKHFFLDIKINLVNTYTSYNLCGVFGVPEHFFYFLCSSYKKKDAPSEFPPHKIGPNLPFRLGKSTERKVLTKMEMEQSLKSEIMVIILYLNVKWGFGK